MVYRGTRGNTQRWMFLTSPEISRKRKLQQKVESFKVVEESWNDSPEPGDKRMWPAVNGGEEGLFPKVSLNQVPLGQHCPAYAIWWVHKSKHRHSCPHPRQQSSPHLPSVPVLPNSWCSDCLLLLPLFCSLDLPPGLGFLNFFLDIF